MALFPFEVAASVCVTVVCGALFQWGFATKQSRRQRSSWHQTVLWITCFAAAGSWHAISVVFTFQEYGGAGFQVLGVGQQLGLVFVSVLLTVALIRLYRYQLALVTRLVVGTMDDVVVPKSQDATSCATTSPDTACRPVGSRAKPRACISFAANVVLTLLMFAVLYNLSPQIYYFYYQLVLPGLPTQWVARSLFDFTSTLILLRPGAFSIAQLLAALTLWSLLIHIACTHLSMVRHWSSGGFIAGILFGASNLLWLFAAH